MGRLYQLCFQPVDVALVKSKGKIAKNTGRCTKILLQWKFQIDLANLTLKQNISENDPIIRFSIFFYNPNSAGDVV